MAPVIRKARRSGQRILFFAISIAIASCGRAPSSSKATSNSAGQSSSSTEVLLVGLSATSIVKGDDSNTFKWIVFPSATQFSLASDGSKITITGSGTFAVGDPEQVSGGGTWATFDSSGTKTASGNFQVTGLAKFDLAPGP